MVSTEIKASKQNSRQVLSIDDFTPADIQAIVASEPPLETINFDSEFSEHENWFLEQVEQAFSEADEPDAVFIPHEIVMANLKTKLDNLATKK